MKNMNKKSILLLIAVAVLVFGAVGGTLAFLIDDTDPVTNTFTPSTIGVEVEDEVEDGVKKDVKIVNTSNIPVYVRVAIVANWCDSNGDVVAPWNDYDAIDQMASGWDRDGIYYYYNGTLKPAGDANNEDQVIMFTDYDPGEAPVEGAHLEMDIIAQVIQAEGMNATSAKDAFTKAQ